MALVPHHITVLAGGGAGGRGRSGCALSFRQVANPLWLSGLLTGPEATNSSSLGDPRAAVEIPLTLRQPETAFSPPLDLWQNLSCPERGYVLLGIIPAPAWSSLAFLCSHHLYPGLRQQLSTAWCAQQPWGRVCQGGPRSYFLPLSRTLASLLSSPVRPPVSLTWRPWLWLERREDFVHK